MLHVSLSWPPSSLPTDIFRSAPRTVKIFMTSSGCIVEGILTEKEGVPTVLGVLHCSHHKSKDEGCRALLKLLISLSDSVDVYHQIGEGTWRNVSQRDSEGHVLHGKSYILGAFSPILSVAKKSFVKLR